MAGAQVALGLASAVRDRHTPSRDGRNRGEDRVGLLPVPHVEIRQAGLTVGALILLADDEDPVGIGVGVWLEQDAVDDAEDGCVQADAEAKAQNRDRRESLAVPEAADRVANVLEEHLSIYGSGAAQVAEFSSVDAGVEH